MPQLGNLSVSVTADLTGLKNGLAQAQAQMRGASVEAERMGSTMETAHGRAGTAAGRAGAQHLQAGEAAKRGGRAAEDAGGSWTHLGHALSGVHKQTTGAQQGLKGAAQSLGLVQVGAILAGASITAFATHAVVSAEEAGQAAYEMSEKFGILPTQASAWVAAGGQLGVSAASMSSGFKFLAKNLEAINLKTTANQAKELTAAQKAVEAAAKQHDTAELHLADTQAKLAGKTHLTTSEQIALRDAQQKVTDSTNKLNEAQGRLSVAQAGLDPKSVSARAALDSLGIKSEDAAGKIRPINDLLFEVSDKFQMMEDGPEKAGLAMKLFGKQGADLIPVLNAGRAGIEGLMAAGRASGAVQSPEQIEAAHKAYLAHMALNQAIAGVSNELGAALLPSFAKLADLLSKQVIPVVLRLVNEGLARLKQFLGDIGINQGILAASVAFGVLVPVLYAVAGAALAATWASLPLLLPIVGLAAAAYLVITHWSQISPILNRVREGLAPLHVIFDRLGRLWQETIIPGLRSLGVSMGPIGDEFKRAFAEWLPILQPIAAAIRDFYVMYWSVLITAFQVLFPIAITYVVTAFKVLGQVIDLIAAVFRGDWGRVGQDFQNINNIMAEALHVVVVKIRQSIDWLGLEVLRLLLAMTQGIEDLFMGLVHRTEDLIGVAFKAAVLNPVQNVHDEATRLMQQMADTLSGIWDGLKGVASSAWGGITGAIKNELRSIVGVVNDFVKAANTAFGSFGLKLPTMDVPGLAAGGNLGSGRFASGGVLELASGGRVGAGFMTNGPSAIVGEGRAQFPEYVIPSDPAYRSNALSLMGSAAKAMGLAEGGLVPALAAGGLVGTIGGECLSWVEGQTGKYWAVAGAKDMVPFINSQVAKAGEIAIFTAPPWGHAAILESAGDQQTWPVIDSNFVAPETVGEHVMNRSMMGFAGFVDTGSGVPGGLAAVAGGLASGALDKIFDPANSAMKGLPGVLGPALGVGMLKSIEDGVKSRMASATSFAGAPTGHAASGAHGDWLHTAEQIAGVGIDWDSGLSTIIEHESGWNPLAANLNDSNFLAGNPSRGLLQLTESNQRAYGGLTDDPIQQIVEGIRYIKDRYGSIGNVPGVRSVLAGGSYQPYDEGGLLPPGLSMAMNGTGASEHVFTAGQMRSFTRQEALLGKLLAVMQDRGAPIEQHFHGQAVDAAAARQMLSAAAWYSRVGRV